MSYFRMKQLADESRVSHLAPNFSTEGFAGAPSQRSKFNLSLRQDHQFSLGLGFSRGSDPR